MTQFTNLYVYSKFKFFYFHLDTIMFFYIRKSCDEFEFGRCIIITQQILNAYTKISCSKNCLNLGIRNQPFMVGADATEYVWYRCKCVWGTNSQTYRSCSAPAAVTGSVYVRRFRLFLGHYFVKLRNEVNYCLNVA